MKLFLLLIVLTSSLNAKSVLVLNSYAESLEWTKVQNEEIQKNLNRYKSTDLKYYVEFMDTKFFRLTKQRKENLLNYYSKKYKNIKFDTIITTDDNALNFVRKYKNNQLFKNAKVFFCGVNNLSLKDTLDKNIYAGVFESKNPLANLRLAKKINKNLKTIYLISDNTPTGKKEIILYKNKLKAHKEIKYIYLNNKDINKTLTSLKDYDENSLIMLLTFASFYQNGKHLNDNKAVQILSNIYKNPMLIHTNIYINISNSNIIGGDCTDGVTQGDIASNKALEYLNGKKMSDIGFKIKNSNKIYLNVKNLERFGLKVSDFDIKNPVLINKETSFYKLHHIWINTFLIILLITITLIIIFIRLLKKKVKAQLNDIRKKDQLLQQQSKMASMGEMIGAIAHQWRQPLNEVSITIQNQKYDFKNGEIDEAYIKEFIDKNKKTINFMSKTIDDFRDFFRVDKTKQDFKVLETIQSVVSMQSAQLKNHHISLNISGDEFIYNGLQSEFQQVILNLINNAKDALIEKEIKNPTIDINCSKAGTLEQGDAGVVTICDNGGGISEDIINRIFEPYFTTKEQGKGTGMGLYMSKMIIEENMGGSLSVENKDGGACFKIDLSPKVKGGGL